MKDKVLAAIKQRSLNVGIIGLGYVGLPLALRFVESGFRVLAFDIDPEKVKLLNEGKTYIAHIGAERVADAAATGRLVATNDFSRAAEADTLILCVPTPLSVHQDPDMSFVIGSIESVKPYLRKGHVISLESTTYPGTTEELIVPRVESMGLAVGKDAFVLFSPEREDPGNPNFNTQTIPKVVGGATPACREVGVALYSQVIDKVVGVSSCRVAEMTKLLENTYRCVNIGLVNELKTVCDRMGIDIWEVIDAASTKPFGFTPFYPGPGLGGHCIPIDPFYLSWKAKEFGLHTRFIELAGEVNRKMPEFVLSKVALALNDHGKSVKGSKVLVLGVAYKKNIDDIRESPSMELITGLEKLGADVEYCDPHFPRIPKMRRYALDMNSIELTPESIKEYDLVLIATDHDAFDYEMIKANAQLVVDTRGRFREPAPNVVKS